MPRKQPKTLSAKEHEQLLDEFWNLIARLHNKQEIRSFFRDLLSDTESVMLARRIRIARLLLQNKSYHEIRKKVGTGYSTIASVHKWIQGKPKTYKKILP